MILLFLASVSSSEQLANDLIDDDLPVRAWFPDPGELAAIKLRRDPKCTTCGPDAKIDLSAIPEFVCSVQAASPQG